MKLRNRIFSKIFSLGALIGMVLLSSQSIMAQGAIPPTINVSGSAEVKVVPDEVDLSVGVETRNETLQEAKRQNDERISRALDFLKRQGVKDKDVQTDYVSIDPVYDPNPGIDPRTGLPLLNYDKSKALVEPAYYLVRKSIGIKLVDVSQFDLILSGLVTNGVNHVQRTEFRTSELRKHKDNARAMAVRAAKDKAAAMAAELGVKLGKPQSINVNDWTGWSGWSPQGWGGGGGGGAYQNVSQNFGGTSGENNPTVAIGQISVSANVSVSFLIE